MSKVVYLSDRRQKVKQKSESEIEPDFEELNKDCLLLIRQVKKNLEMADVMWGEVERACRLIEKSIVIQRRMLDDMLDKLLS